MSNAQCCEEETEEIAGMHKPWRSGMAGISNI